MADICSVSSCKFEAGYDGKCALHCEKFDYQRDKLSGVIDDFYELLIQYVVININESKTTPFITFEKLKAHVSEDSGKLVGALINKSIIHIKDIHFPEFSVQDTTDYRSILKRFKKIFFGECHFSASQIDLENIEVFFYNCTFHQEYTVSNLGLTLSGYSESLYLECDFQKRVSFVQSEFDHPITKYTAPIFAHCIFNAALEVERIHFEGRLFIDDKLDSSPIEDMAEFKIKDCVFDKKFIFNRYKFELLKIEDCTFKNKVELKNNIIKKLFVDNSNFEALFDAYESKFLSCKFRKSIFDDFTGFEKCLFGKKDDSNIDKVEFEYVTFLNFTNFRKAKFYNGLDLENTNLKESPNFLNAEINFTNTNRETFRIIKHSFDKIGNQIEANKYFSYEMKKYKEELKEQIEIFKRVKRFRLLKNKLEKKKANRVIPKSIKKLIYIESKLKSELWNYRVYKVNEWISNFGENFLKPLKLMLIGTIFYYMLVLGYECNLLYKFDESTNNIINNFMTQVNLFAKGIPPYGKLLKEGMEFTTLLFHVFFLTCTWQFIVAVKRRAKR
jgi:hypothetical protein